MPARVRLLAAFAFVVAPATAADLPPELVGRFTRQVQPLIVNRCAAGACHGGPQGHEPRFARGPATARPDRDDTLANIATFLETVGPDRDPNALVRMLASAHPIESNSSRLAAAPLTATERRTIETWLAAVRTLESHSVFDTAIRQASTTAPANRNRFRDMLDAAVNPPQLEPPREPTGVFFKQDDGTASEPPAAPVAP